MMQIMYEMDVSDAMSADSAKKLCAERFSGRDLRRAESILSAAADDIEEIDALINSSSRSWKTGRMPRVDLAIMRLAIGELRYGDVPKAVIVNEAVNMARKYSTEQSSKFIHGVLGAAIN